MDSFLLSAKKAIGTFLKVKNVEALQKDLKNDMINAEYSTLLARAALWKLAFSREWSVKASLSWWAALS